MSKVVTSDLNFSGVARCINLPDPVQAQDAATRAFVLANSWNIQEAEEPGAGPFDDYPAGNARHIICTNAAGAFNGVVLSGLVGDTLVITHQGAGYTDLRHNQVSSVNTQARLFNGLWGKHLRLYDNESALYRLLDVSGGAGTTLRLVLLSPSFPFANATDNSNGDTLSHDGTSWTAGIAGFMRLVERAAGITLSAGQALFFSKNDAPNNPYYRDDTNADRKIITAPAALTDLATQNEGTVLLRAIGAGPGAPIAGTGAQLGAIARFSGQHSVALSAGTYNDYPLADGTKLVSINATGDVVFTGFALGTSNSGGWFVLYKPGVLGRVILKNYNAGSLASNRVLTPNAKDYIVANVHDSVLIVFHLSGWTVVDQALPSVDANGEGLLFSKRVVCASGGASGTLDDVPIWAGDVPHALRLHGVTLFTSTAGPPASSAALRNAQGGVGSNVFGAATIPTTATGPNALNNTASAALTTNGSLYLRRDRSVVGELLLTYTKG